MTASTHTPSNKFKGLTLKGRLVAFLIFITALIIGVLAWNTWHARKATLRDAEISTTNMARALAQHAEGTIDSVDNVLVGMAESLEYNEWNRENLDRMNMFLRQRVSDLPLLHGLFVYDKDGAWLVNSQEILRTDLNNADREYFIFHRDNTSSGPHIGPPIRSRSTGDWIITISRRLERSDGSFAGVVLATTDMQYFSDFYAGFDIGKAGAIWFATDGGKLLVRRPFYERAIGGDVTAGPIFQHYLKHGPVGTTISTSKIDGVDRIHSYHHLDHHAALLAVALSKDEVLVGWRVSSIRFGIATALLLGMLWLMGWRLIKQVAIRERTQSELYAAKNELEKSNNELAEQALLDGLTGIANRRRFDAALDEEYARAMRNGMPLSLIMLDVDNFKKYNDYYGHPQGDECLRMISNTLKTLQARTGDLVARYGGEEFAILLPSTDLNGAIIVAERARVAIEKLAIEHVNNAAYVVTISAGAASIIPSRITRSPEDLIRVADKALYKAKESGRNKVCSSDSGALGS